MADPGPPRATVLAWGDNLRGRLGDGTTTDRTRRVKIQGLSGITMVTAGGGHSLALLADGSVRSWGQNRKDQLGDNATTDRSTPVEVQGEVLAKS